MSHLKQKWLLIQGMLVKFLFFMVLNAAVFNKFTTVEGTDDKHVRDNWLKLNEFDEILQLDKYEYARLLPDGTSHSFYDDYSENSFRVHVENEWKDALDKNNSRPFLVCSSLIESQGFDRAQRMSQLIPFLQRPREQSVVEHNVNEALCNTKQHTCWVFLMTAQDIISASNSDTKNTLRTVPLIPTVKFLGRAIESIDEREIKFLVTFPHKLSTAAAHNIKERVLQDAKNPNCTSEYKTRSLREEVGQSEVRKRFPWSRTLDSYYGKDETRSLRNMKSLESSDVESKMDHYHLHQLNTRAQMWHRALIENSSTCECTKQLEEHKPVFQFDEENHSMEISIRENYPHDCKLSFLASISIQVDVGFITVVPRMNLMSINNTQKLSYAQNLMHGNNDNKSNPWYNAGLTGLNQVVGVADTGLDHGHCLISDGSDYKNLNSKADLARKKVIYYYGADTIDHVDGHGTAVSSIIAGKINGKQSDFEGVAPDARISFFDISYDQSDINNKGQACCSIPPQLGRSLFRLHKAGQARIINVSWGITDEEHEGQYLPFDMMFDNVVKHNPDILIVVANGNNGPNAGSVASPANAKNVISVGMTFSDEGKRDELASRSARGPTTDGRIKPDVCAPGNYLVVARARPDLSDGVCDDGTIPGRGEETIGLKTLAGTSMSAPMVAGTAALLAQYFEEGRHITGEKNDSKKLVAKASLLKATLVNIAQPVLSVENSDIQTEMYDFDQGFGRIILDDSVPLPTNGLSAIIVNEKEMMYDEEDEHRIEISLSGDCNQNTLSATLAWTETPGAINCRSCLLNDVDLEVEVKRADTTHIIHPNGRLEADEINTVERIRETFSDGEEVIVRVKAGNFLYPSQAYSLIVTGCFINIPESNSLQDPETSDSLMLQHKDLLPMESSDVSNMQSTSLLSQKPSHIPSSYPSAKPSNSPSISPSSPPSESPSSNPTKTPTKPPSLVPSFSPTDMPSNSPSSKPSNLPSQRPSNNPSDSPSSTPSKLSISSYSTTAFQHESQNNQVYSSEPLFPNADEGPYMTMTSKNNLTPKGTMSKKTGKSSSKKTSKKKP